jgi:hypothetical protein
MSLPEEEARALGVPTGPLRAAVVAAATLVTAASVSAAGIIGWVGLVVPHLARFLVGPGFPRLLPTAAVLGGGYLLVIDTLARTAAPVEIPLGILTAVVGTPFFIALLRTARSGGRRTWMLRCGATVAEPSLQVKEIIPTPCVHQLGWWEAVVTFDLADPAAQRLGTAPELGRDRHDRWPRCGMLDLMIQHHPGCAVPDLGRKACRRLRQVALPSQEFGPPEIPAPFRTSAPSTPWSSGATSSSARSTASATTPADGPSSCASGCASRSCPFGRAVRPGSSQSCESWSVRVERRSPGRDAGGPHGPDQLARAPVARTTGIQVARSRA